MGYNLILNGIGTSAPPVVSGYAFYIDAANPSSYPGSGSTWTDLSVNANNVTLNNSPTFDGSDGTGSLVFDGMTQNGQFANDINLTGGYTIEAWVKYNDFSDFPIVISRDTHFSNFDWCLANSDASHVDNYTNGANSHLTISTGTALSTGVWYYIAFSGNAANTTSTYYINNVSIGSGSLSITDGGGPGSIASGSWNSPGQFLNGKIGVIRVYQSGLTSTQITQNWNAQRSRYGY